MQQRQHAAADQGELVIDLPVSLTADLIDDFKDLVADASSDKVKPEQVDLEANLAPPVPLDKLPLVQLKIEYQVLDPLAAAMFYGNANAENPVLDPLYMLTESRFGMARFWMPCIDSINWYDRCLFDLDVVVDPHLFAVASGELNQTIALTSQASPSQKPAKLFRYSLYAPALPSEIVLAVGPFIPLPDPTIPHSITHFCLPGFAKELVHTAPPLLAKSLAFCRDYFGADPPISSYKQIFVGSRGLDPSCTVSGAGGIVVLSGDLLHSSRSIDEAFAAREAIMNGLVMSYFGRFLRPRTLEDDWLISGLAAHVSALGLQTILGRNWYIFRIWDTMESLRKEPSLDLANPNVDRVTASSLAALRKRSHMIVYMIAKRIGGDVLKRALRDIVAEGRSATIAAVSKMDTILSKHAVHVRNSASSDGDHFQRQLTDLINVNSSSNGNLSVVTSGFDDAIQGVGVGPFLKRIRGIIGTDVRSMVRLWASSPGIPRLQVAYHYNARKHCIELVIKQDCLSNGPGSEKKGLLFTGTINIRVMETEGEYDHTVEVSDPVFIAEIPCHSRRSKHKSGAQAEKEFNENPARASPILWIRFDPDQEWCTECNFKQTKSAWISVLNSGRDAMGQFEACRGLAGSGHKVIVNKLLTVLKDEQIYWRVRAEAARILSSTEEGLKNLLSYFRESYTESPEEKDSLLLPQNYSNIANYFVKRAVLSAVADSRIKGSRTAKRPQGSVSLEAAKFLSHVLSGHDNTGNEFDDDHFLCDVLRACADVAINSIDDPVHTTAGDDGLSTTDSIVKLMERFRAIEHMVPRRSSLVKSALLKSLSDIEIAKLSRQDEKEHGKVLKAMTECTFRPNQTLVNGLYEISSRNCSLSSRVSSASCLANLYGGDLEIVLWILARIDCVSSGLSMTDLRKQLGSEKGTTAEYAFAESPALRYGLLEALSDAAKGKLWRNATPPLTSALRRHTRRAVQACLRIQKLVVEDPDPRVRASALRFAKIVWGSGTPVCLLTRQEYWEASRLSEIRPPKNLVPLKRNASTLPPQITEPRKDAKPVKSHKSSRSSKHGKNGRISKPGRKHSIKISLNEPVPRGLPAPRVPNMAPIDVDATVPLVRSSKPPQKPASLAQTAKKPPRPQQMSAAKPPLSRPIPPKPPLSRPLVSTPTPRKPPQSKPRDKEPEGRVLKLRSVPADKPKRPQQPKPVAPPLKRFPWEPLDSEDKKFLQRAWTEKQPPHPRPSFRSVPLRSKPVLSTPKTMKRVTSTETDEGVKSSRGPDSDDVVFVSHNEGRGLENGADSVHGVEPKKKKKRKRTDDDVKEKKKKKKKKKHKERGELGDGESSRAGTDAEDNRKVGKFKIKLNGPLAHVARSE